MNGDRSIERRLPAILADLSAAPYPDYTDALLDRTASARQRPGWVFAERWLPVGTVSSAAATAPRVPWRLVGALALLILALALGAFLIAGSRPQPLPAPFGLAENGLLAYSADGDIYTSDPVTGEAKAIIAGPDADRDPVWSRDGTRLAFVRRTVGEAADRLYVVRSDGGGLTELTREPMLAIGDLSFSPDGREVLFVSESTRSGVIQIAKADGTGMRTLDVGIPASEPTYRPSDGKLILFSGSPADGLGAGGIYVVNADGTGLRNLVEAKPTASAGGVSWSPDGSQIAFSDYDMTVPEWTAHTSVMSPDGSDLRALPMANDAKWNYNATWSNDGTRIVTLRGYDPYGQSDDVVAVVPADGSGPGVETTRSRIPDLSWVFEWAPDDTSVVIAQRNPADKTTKFQLMDPMTGEVRPATYSVASRPSWQRLASAK
jgi:dipeptidyl aminopeptidase/acylaminoacyl peptidase